MRTQIIKTAEVTIDKVVKVDLDVTQEVETRAKEVVEEERKRQVGRVATFDIDEAITQIARLGRRQMGTPKRINDVLLRLIDSDALTRAVSEASL